MRKSTQNSKEEKSIFCNGVGKLRRQLIQMDVWPDAGDQLLALMPNSKWHSPPLTEADNQWLPKVVDAVIDGVDIGSNYPAFFHKLLVSDALRQSFLQALNAKFPS